MLKVILELMYSSALRPREVYNLKIKDIDFKNRQLFIKQSKRKKDRIVPVGKYALNLLHAYIQSTKNQIKKPDSPENVNGHKLIQKKRALKSAEIDDLLNKSKVQERRNVIEGEGYGYLYSAQQRFKNKHNSTYHGHKLENRQEIFGERV